MDKVRYEASCLGYIQSYDPNISKRLYYVTKLNIKKSLTTMTLYELYSGVNREIRIWTSSFNRKPFTEGDVINITKIAKKNKRKPETNSETGKTEWVPVMDEWEYWLESYDVGEGGESY